MGKLDKTDNVFIWLSAVLIIVSALIFLTIPERGLFLYLFGALILLIFSISSLMMAGLAYSIGQEGGEIEFIGKESIFARFCRMSDEDSQLLLGLIVFLLILLLALNALMYYQPF